MVRDRPSRIKPEEAVLRIRLIMEEAFELAEAAGVDVNVRGDKEGQHIQLFFDDLIFTGGLQTRQDVIEIADAIADSIYVQLGAALQWGIDIDRCFDLVQENNMLKVVNGTIDENGKLKKPKDHPKVDLSFCSPPDENKPVDLSFNQVNGQD